MKPSLLLLVLIVASTIAAPIPSSQNSQPTPRNKDTESTMPSTITVKDTANSGTQLTKKQSARADSMTKSSKTPLLIPFPSKDQADSEPDMKSPNEDRDKFNKRNRKQKTIFSGINYPIQQLPLSAYDLNYNTFDTEERAKDTNEYQESSIFYIRLPPTPYMFVPGLGYISQPPTYSTYHLRPQSPKPLRPKPYQTTVNPFIKLPIDFVSNGKPTSVYQWQMQNKKPMIKDSPITNLGNEFVSNGKPTSIYQWQTNLKPVKADDIVNELDKGPYFFNGKPSSFFLLKSDGTYDGKKQLQYPDYREDNYY